MHPLSFTLLASSTFVACGGRVVDSAKAPDSQPPPTAIDAGAPSDTGTPAADVADDRPHADPQWVRQGNARLARARTPSVAFDASGNILAVGTHDGSVDFGAGRVGNPFEIEMSQMFATKFDPSGKALWTITSKSSIGGGTNANAGMVDPVGGLIATGTFERDVDLGGAPLASKEGYAGWLARFDAEGRHSWSRSLGSIWLSALTMSSSKRIIGAGGCGSPVEPTPLSTICPSEGAVILTVGPSGDVVAGEHFDNGFFQGLALHDTTGTMAVIGRFRSLVVNGTELRPPDGFLDTILLVRRADGVRWAQHWPVAAWSRPNGNVAFDAEGNVLVASRSDLPDEGPFAAKYTMDGALVWKVSLRDDPRALVVDPSGDPLVAHTVGPDDTGQTALRMLDGKTGSTKWTRVLERSGWATYEVPSVPLAWSPTALAVSGTFDRTVDFGVDVLTNKATRDVFIARLTL